MSDATSHGVVGSSHGPGWVGDHEVLLHIGLPKTGTTSLQSCAAHSRAELLDHGILYPRTDTRPKGRGATPNHVPAAFAPLGWPQPPAKVAQSTMLWDRLVADVAGHTGRVFVSAENVAAADSEVAGRIVEDLGGPRVRVAVTMRPMHVLLPSFWQNEVRSGLQTPFEDWLRRMADGPGGANALAPFWILYDLGAMVERWSSLVGADHVAVVVVDSRQPDQVFRQFEQLLGLPAGTLEPERTRRTNRSLTGSEAELVRRLNIGVAGEMEAPPHGKGAYGTRALPETVVRRVLDGRESTAGDRQLVVPSEVVDRFRPLAAAAVDQIRSIAPLVLGDLDLLVPGPGVGDEPEPAAETVAIEAVTLVIEELLRIRDRQRITTDVTQTTSAPTT